MVIPGSPGNNCEIIFPVKISQWEPYFNSYFLENLREVYFIQN
jgi:hypothetical protein